MSTVARTREKIPFTTAEWKNARVTAIFEREGKSGIRLRLRRRDPLFPNTGSAARVSVQDVFRDAGAKPPEHMLTLTFFRRRPTDGAGGSKSGGGRRKKDSDGDAGGGGRRGSEAIVTGTGSI